MSASETRKPGASRADAETETTDSRIVAHLSVGRTALARVDPKKLSTLTAKACLCGVVLHCIEDDYGAPLFVASKWSLTRQMSSLEEVSAWLDRIGGDCA